MQSENYLPTAHFPGQNTSQTLILAWFLNKTSRKRPVFAFCDLLHCHNSVFVGFQTDNFARNQLPREDLLCQRVFDLLLDSTF